MLNTETQRQCEHTLSKILYHILQTCLSPERCTWTHKCIDTGFAKHFWKYYSKCHKMCTDAYIHDINLSCFSLFGSLAALKQYLWWGQTAVLSTAHVMLSETQFVLFSFLLLFPLQSHSLSPSILFSCQKHIACVCETCLYFLSIAWASWFSLCKIIPLYWKKITSLLPLPLFFC